MAPSLTALLLAARGAAVTPALEATLEPELARIVAEARAAWPTVDVAPARFVAHLAARLPDGPLAAGLAALHAGDLYLACAVEAGDAAALAIFRGRLLASDGPVLGRIDPALRDDLAQEVCARLLIPGDGAPRIASYRGKSPLIPWLRVVAMRTAINSRRKRWDALGVSDVEAQVRDPAADPEVGYFARLYRGELKAAFQAVLADLPTRERNMLRLYFIDGLTHEAIGRLFKVHNSTIHRRLTRLRQELLDRTRDLLAARLALPPSQVGSVLAGFGHDLSVSLVRFLGEPSEPSSSS